MGAPCHQPTPESRKKVIGFTSSGFTQQQIADYFDLDSETIKKYYAEELKKTKMDKTSKLGGSIYRRGLKGDTKAAMFWLRTQAGWIETKDKETDNAPLIAKLLEMLGEKKQGQ